MAFTSSRTKIELLSPVDGSVLVNITTKGRSAGISRRPTYANRGYHRSAAVTAARLRTQGTITLQLNADDLALLHELERWQKGVVWYPMRADLKGRRHRQPDLRITFLDAQGAVEEVVRAYGVKLSDESLDLGMGPAKESISLDVLGGFEPKEGGYEPVRALDFHRTGPATYLAPDGLKTAGDGVARFGVPGPVVRRNLLGDSQNLGSISWTRNAVSVSYVDADGQQITTTNNFANIYQNISVAPGAVLTMSWYAKRGTMADMKYVIANVTAGGNIVGPTSYYASTNSDAYSRISVTFTVPAGCTQVQLQPLRDSLSQGTCYIGRPQLELGSTATPYQPTNATGPDLTHPLNGAGLVLEGAGTNLWNRTDISATINAGSSYYYASIDGLSGNTTYTLSLAKALTAGTASSAVIIKADCFNGTTYLSTIAVSHYGDATSTPQSNAVTFTTPANTTRLNVYIQNNSAGNVSVSNSRHQLEQSPFQTSYMGPGGTRSPDLCGIVHLQNELIHSRDLTQSAWTVSGMGQPTKSGTNNTVTFGATGHYFQQAVALSNAASTTRTVAIRLKLGTLSGSVVLRLRSFDGVSQYASVTINTSDLSASEARTFYVSATPGATETGLTVRLSGNSGTGTVIVESLRLVRGYHPGVEVQTGDTPILPPPSPALGPAWSQNGRVRFRVLPPPYASTSAAVGKTFALFGLPGLNSVLGFYKYTTNTAINTAYDRKHNGSTGSSGTAGWGYLNSAVWLHDGALHEIILEWTNEINETTGVREMWQRLYIDGALVAQQDVAALYGATAWAEIDPSRLISDGNVHAVLSRVSLDYPTPRSGYRQVC